MTIGTAPQSRRSLTRDDLIALGRAGRAREFIPIGMQAIQQIPGDAGLRFLLAANIAQLGLRTLAAEELATLRPSAQDTPDVRSLSEAIARLPDDRLSTASRRAAAVTNMRALRVRGIDLADAFEAWSEGLDGTECFRCADGNLVWRRQKVTDWARGLIDQRGIADRFVETHLGGGELFPKPLAIEGIDPPWLALSAWRALKPNRVGYQPPLTVLQADVGEFLDGLSVADLADLLIDPRVRVFVGADASERWMRDALARLDEVVLGSAAALPGTRARIAPSAEAVTGRVSAALAEEFRRLQSRIAARYSGRNAAWWARRYGEAARGTPPLRVLIPTSRFSTYIRHAAEDLAEAFRSLGCEALVSMEARADSRPSSVGHARAVDGFEPDLIALINYFRGDAGLPFPAEIPWLCWLQDALPHQFGRRSWGELDFVAGHVHKELAADAGFPRERAVQFPVVASARKFHAGPIDPGVRERFACEIAYVSHQSETPRAFHERCLSEANDAGAARLLEALRPRIENEASDPMGSSLTARIERVTRDIVEGSGSDGSAYIYRHYSLPLADRALRHQMLGWAADLCRRHGWRLHIYGRGWDKHPELAAFARGEVEHGEQLRACYAAAAVHLHASVNTLVHQRVMECALSGGLPLGRLIFDAVSESTGFAKREAILRDTPSARDAATGAVGYRIEDSPALEAVAAERRALGMDFPELLWITAAQVESFRRPDHAAATGLHAGWLFGHLADTTFRTDGELERLVALATADAHERSRRSAEIADRVRERCTTEVFAARVLTMMRGSLEASASRPGERCA